MTTTDDDPTPDSPRPPWCEDDDKGIDIEPSEPPVYPDPNGRTERIVANVLRRIAHPRPCPSCGDLTCASLCPACVEWNCKQLDLDFAPVGWA